MTVESQTTVEFEFEGFDPADDERAEQVAREVREAGGRAEVRGEGDGTDFAFIPVILGAMALVALIHVIKNLVDDLQVGVVIDARGDKIVTRKDKTLPRGTVVVASTEGDSVELVQPDKETLADAVKAAVKAGG
jgi:hypothetical protein